MQNGGCNLKIRKTLTNIKRIDRIKITFIFILFQIVAVPLFCILGIVGTAHANDDNTTVITSKIEDYHYVNISAGRLHSVYFKVQIDGKQYHIGSGNLTVSNDAFDNILNDTPVATVRVHHDNKIAEMYSNGIEYVSINKYNANKNAERTLAIILFSLTEVFVCSIYVIYILYHRTSKDKKIDFIYQTKRKTLICRADKINRRKLWKI